MMHPTVPSAFMTGLTAGNAKTTLEIEAGLAYMEMLDNGVSEETARTIATGVGAVNAGLEFLQLDELVKAYKVLDKTGADDSFLKIVLRELAKRGVDIAKEAGQEVLQEGVTTAGAQLGSKLDTGDWAYTFGDVTERLWNTAKDSALTFGLTNIPSVVHNVDTQNHIRTTDLAAQGEARLRAGEMPALEQLRAMNLSEPEARGKMVMLNLDKLDENIDAATRMEHNNVNAKVATASPTFANSKDRLYQNSKSIKPINGYEDVVVHGDMYGFVFKNADGVESNVSVREFARILKESGLYNGGDVRLISCETGKTGSIAAQGLADELGVNILAPTDVVYVYPDGKMIVSSDDYTDDGEWTVFEPKKKF